MPMFELISTDKLSEHHMRQTLCFQQFLHMRWNWIGRLHSRKKNKETPRCQG
jgi:hypothetical protein